ncbi:MAG: glycosyltransferase family 4 protein [Thermoplasmata archaeon]
MRILILNHSNIISKKPGADLHIYNTAKSLSNTNEVTVLTWGSGESKEIKEGNLRIIHLGNGGKDIISSIYDKFPRSIFGTISYLGFYYLLFPQLFKGPSPREFNKLGLGNFDLVIRVAFDNNKIPKYLKKKFKTKTIELAILSGLPNYLDNSHVWLRKTHKFSHNSLIIFKFFYKIMKQIVLSFYISTLSSNNIIVVSEYDKNVFNHVKNLKVTYIPPIAGILYDPEKYNYDLPDDNIILFSGSRFWITEEALQYIFYAAKKLPNLKFYVTGYVPSYLKEYNVPENVKLLGYLDNEKYIEIYNKSSIYLLPLIGGSGVQNRMIEALAYGKAIITTSVIAEEFPNLINGEHAIIEDDPDEFINKIKMVAENANLRKKLSTNARTYYEKYLSKEIALKLTENYLFQVVNEN